MIFTIFAKNNASQMCERLVCSLYEEQENVDWWKRICDTHKNFKTSTMLCINITKSALIKFN